MFILNDTAKKHPAVQMAMQNYIKQLQLQEERRQKILSGEYIPVPDTSWNISDRH